MGVDLSAAAEVLPGDRPYQSLLQDRHATLSIVVRVKFCKFVVGQTGPLKPGGGRGRGRHLSALPWSVL